VHDEDPRRRAGELFRRALSRTAGRPGLETVRRELIAAGERIHQPMRVAIVGLIKAGKSTLMNALLGELIVPTGTIETTYNVNWLKHGDPPGVRVHFKDDRPAEERSFGELAALTRRSRESLDRLDEIRYLEVLHPNPLLRLIELIDLPGLASFYERDSENARDFLRLHGKRLTEITEEEASRADAVLYLFSRGLHDRDQSALEELQGPALGKASPINSIGVLTKVDAYWPRAEAPVETGHEIAARLIEHPQARNLFYLVTPVCGLLAEGAAALGADDLDALRELAALPEERFERLIRDAGRFAERSYPDVPVPPERRRPLLERLGLYGVHLACRLLRSGECGAEGLRRALVERSGLNRLRDLVLAHFGRRALLIQLEAALLRLKAVCFAEQRRLAGEGKEIVEEIAGDLEAFEMREPAFQELRVLRDLYRGKLDLDAEEQREVLAVTGENGSSLRARLGLNSETDGRELARIARERASRWQTRSLRLLPVTPETLAAARVVARAYEALAFRLEPENPFHLEEEP
jgi:GTPase SAR1 family protein